MRRLFGTLSALAMVLIAAPAYASIIGIFSVSGANQNAIVAFDVTGTTFRVGVVNTGGPGQVDEIAAMISGVDFTFTGGGTLNSASLSGTAAGAVDCTANVPTCAPIPVPANQPGAAFGAPVANGGWTNTAAGLFAGAGSFKPLSVANNNITGDTDGVPNAQHNPYLIGPVIFSMSFTGNITAVTAADIYFGTGPLILPGSSCPACPTPFVAPPPPPAPEPGSMMLLGSGLFGFAAMLRRRARKSK